jgi:hypothetical protein
MKRQTRREPLGIRSARELLVHRELEYLRVAGRRRPRRIVAARWRKLEAARALAERKPRQPTGGIAR